MATLPELISVLEGEVQLGETLLLNLTAQKEAILAWDSTALLSQVEKKEHLVRLLAEMEERRQEIVRQLFHECGLSETKESPALKVFLSRTPSSPQTSVLAHLQHRTWQIYNRLRAEEKQLTSLMGVLLNHIGEALHAFTPPPQISTYGGNGALAALRPRPGLIQGKV